jgi:chemotaxis methyl-accepting protein methylase
VLTVREPGAWDVVLCRNLVIYLQPGAAAVLWRQLAAAVRPGGLLVLGKAERPGGDGRLFTPAGPCVFRRTGADNGLGGAASGDGGNEAAGVADVA